MEINYILMVIPIILLAGLMIAKFIGKIEHYTLLGNIIKQLPDWRPAIDPDANEEDTDVNNDESLATSKYGGQGGYLRNNRTRIRR